MQFERVWTARWQCLLGRQNPRPQTWSARDVMSEQCLVIFVLALRQADVRVWLVLPPVSLDARRSRMHVFIYFLDHLSRSPSFERVWLSARALCSWAMSAARRWH